MTKAKKIIKKIAKIAGAGMLGVSLLVTAPVATPKAEAFLCDIAASIIQGALAYDANQKKLLSAGNNPAMQDQSYRLANGDDKIDRPVDEQAVKLTDEVMNQLINNGNYVLKNNSLPFRWKVVPSNSFNASCNLTDFIAVNDKLVSACNYNRDELAAVLGHEMTHGYDQHVVHNSSKKILASVATGIAGNVMASSNWGVGAVLGIETLQFLTVKNVDVDSELTADEKGFYVMSSAGFNPGGTCAMLARMKYYTDHNDQLKDFFNPVDHPDTQRRLSEAEKFLTDYGMKHAEVRHIDMVYFDEEYLLRAEEEGAMDQEEMAYLIVGGIAKAFHDNDSFIGWNFRKDEKGRTDFLDDNEVYGPLKRAIERNNLGDPFAVMVEKAYQTDLAKGIREEFKKKEDKRLQELEKKRQKQLKQKDDSKDKVINGNTYIKLGLVDFAEKEYLRAQTLDSTNPSAKSGIAVVMGKRGNIEVALQLANEAIKMDPECGNGYTARALIYKEMGDMENSLNDCKKAVTVPKKDNYAHKLAGDIFDLSGNHASALAEYKEYKDNDKWATDIPVNYANELK